MYATNPRHPPNISLKNPSKSDNFSKLSKRKIVLTASEFP